MNIGLIHKSYRNQIRKIITTYPQIDGGNPLFNLCIELINASHQSNITLERLTSELIGIITEQRRKISSNSNQVGLALVKQVTLEWLNNENKHAKAPIQLVNILRGIEQEFSDTQNLITQLEKIKKATIENQTLLNNIYKKTQILVGILNNYLIDRKNLVQNNKVKEYKNTYLPFFQKSYQQKEEAIEALKEALAGNPIELKKYLSTLSDSNLGKELKKFVKSGQADVLVNKEVYTLTDFINTLDAQVNSESAITFVANFN
ncbi:Uncharacterised protein [Legionella busanensis]|uniref:Uncharacterized protein n=1 Tax=Legionella busanensis TaxID=190655 RepID=A0A378JQY2_9GAMM|nr:hypothetical protein [Legionella busanensis]STX52300.1 Uncharacterised protein [Legionella busanensis]